MKKLDLNIQLKETLKSAGEKICCPHCKEFFRIKENEDLTPVEVAQIWIQNIIERSLNEPKIDPQTGQLVATKNQIPEVHRKYNKIMDKIDTPVEGVVDLEDDDLKWIEEKFNNPKGGVPIQRSVSKVIAALTLALHKAEVSDEKINS